MEGEGKGKKREGKGREGKGTSKSELLWEPLFTPDLSTFLIGITKLKLS
jgi:hypothetical protein